MKKFYCIAVAMLFSCAHVYSQFAIQLQVPPLGLTIKPQLWNLMAINASKKQGVARIELTMTDVSNNQRVLTGTSSSFFLSTESKQLQMKDLMPITYSTSGAGYVVDPSPEGFLPVGVFNICYSMITDGKDGEEVLAEACETFEIEPLSPPMLVLPSDKDSSAGPRPLFSWLPPAPSNMFTALRYDFILTEVFSTQSPADAVQQNIPVVSQSNINTLNYQYPTSLSPLDPSKTYAWRIAAKNGMATVGNSEVWSFRVGGSENSAEAVRAVPLFSKLRREDDASYIVAKDRLEFIYEHETSDTLVTISIHDITSGSRQELRLESTQQKVKYGQNYLQLDLHNLRLENKHIYHFELINSRREKWHLKFEYRKP